MPDVFPALVAWQALAIVFALIPIMAVHVYLYDCARERRRATLRGYFRLLLGMQRAKKEAYERTAESIAGESSPVVRRLLVATMLLTVVVVGSDWIFVAVGYVVLTVAIPLTVYLGSRHSDDS